MDLTIATATSQVEHVISTLQQLHASPIAGASERSIRNALALLHGALNAIDLVRFSSTSPVAT